MTLLCQAAAETVAAAARPLLLSADCTTAQAAAAALQRRHREFAVVWLDGHGDFNTPATTITGYLVLVDARDLDPAERDLLTASHVCHIPAAPDAIRSAMAPLRHLPVYLHLDVDIVDSAQLAGLRVPAGPGPSLTQIEECVTAITSTVQVTGGQPDNRSNH
jgi:arginase